MNEMSKQSKRGNEGRERREKLKFYMGILVGERRCLICLELARECKGNEGNEVQDGNAWREKKRGRREGTLLWDWR